MNLGFGGPGMGGGMPPGGGFQPDGNFPAPKNMKAMMEEMRKEQDFTLVSFFVSSHHKIK